MDLLSLSSYSSLAVQLITGIIGFDGLFLKLNKEDLILQQSLKLETFVQLIEFIFYIYLVYSLYFTAGTILNDTIYIKKK